MRNSRNVNIYKAIVKTVKEVNGEDMSMGEVEHYFLNLADEEKATEVWEMYKQGYLEI